MTHIYKRHIWTPDGRHLVDVVELTGVDVAIQLGKGVGGRLEFLELVNRWNRIGAHSPCDGPRYLYLAEVTSA